MPCIYLQYVFNSQKTKAMAKLYKLNKQSAFLSYLISAHVDGGPRSLRHCSVTPPLSIFSKPQKMINVDSGGYG